MHIQTSLQWLKVQGKKHRLLSITLGVFCIISLAGATPSVFRAQFIPGRNYHLSDEVQTSIQERTSIVTATTTVASSDAIPDVPSENNSLLEHARQRALHRMGKIINAIPPSPSHDEEPTTTHPSATASPERRQPNSTDSSDALDSFPITLRQFLSALTLGPNGTLMWSGKPLPGWNVVAPAQRPPTRSTSSGSGESRRGGGGSPANEGTDGRLEAHNHQTNDQGGTLDINSATTGTLFVSRGGTGLASYNTGDLLVGQNGGGLSPLTIGTNGQVLKVENGTATWGSIAAAFSTGNTLTITDPRYVNISGDTMTGTLTLNPSSGLALNARGTISGSLVTQNGAGSNYFMGSVGIGTTTPGALLDLSRNDSTVTSTLRISQAGAGDPQLELRIPGTRGWGLGLDNSDSDKFKISDVSADGNLGTSPMLTIDTSGNVGIGTASPSDKLHVLKASGHGGLILENTGGVPYFTLRSAWGSGEDALFALVPGAGQMLASAVRGDLVIGNSTNQNILFGNTETGTSEYMRIASTGNVGIGTTSPVGKFQVRTSTDLNWFVTSGNGDVSGAMTLNAVNDANTANIPMELRGSSFVFIGGSGNGRVGIGKVSPATQLDVVGTISGSGLRINGVAAFTGTTILTANSASAVPLVVKGAASQTANLMQWKNSAGTTLGYVSTTDSRAPNGSNDLTIAATLIAIPSTVGQYLKLQSSNLGNGISILMGGSDLTITAPTIYLNGALSHIVNAATFDALAPAGQQQASFGIRTAADEAESHDLLVYAQTANTGTTNGSYQRGGDLLLYAGDAAANSNANSVGGDIVLRAGANTNSSPVGSQFGKVIILQRASSTVNLLELQNSSTNKLAVVDATGQIQSSTGGLVTTVVAGACSDASFSTDTNGTICIDSSNGRFYFRYGGAWHYAAQTAGFQIPNIERNGKLETEGLDINDRVIGRIDEVMEDGALHGIWEEFDVLTEVKTVIQNNPDILTNIGANPSPTDIVDLTVQGSLYVMGKANFLGDVAINGTLSVSSKQAGMLSITAGSTAASVTFTHPFAMTPIITATPAGMPAAFWGMFNASGTGLTMRLSQPMDADLIFTWLAIPTVDGIPTLSASAASAEESPPNDETSQDTGSGSTEEQEENLTDFPVDNKGYPISSDANWNSCIRNVTPLNEDGSPIDCARFTLGSNRFEHPDLRITFTFNDNLTPYYYDLPSGYRIKVVDPTSSADSAEPGESENGEEQQPATGTGSVKE